MKGKGRYVVGVMVLGLLTFGAIFAIKAFDPAEVNAQGSCNLNTIKGTYIFQARGVVIDSDEIVPYAEAGTWTLDGEGGATGTISISINGETIVSKENFEATYAHSADCVFTAEDAFGLQFDLYTTPSGRNVSYYSPGFSGTMVKY